MLRARCSCVKVVGKSFGRIAWDLEGLRMLGKFFILQSKESPTCSLRTGFGPQICFILPAWCFGFFKMVLVVTGISLQYSCLENSADRSLAGCSPWGHEESDTEQQIHTFKNRILHRNLCSWLILKNQKTWQCWPCFCAEPQLFVLESRLTPFEGQQSPLCRVSAGFILSP